MKFDAAAEGTSAAEWDSSGLLSGVRDLDPTSIKRLAVIAAHPDDEVLGAGGLIVSCATLGIPVQVVVVTDGGRSNPDSTVGAADIARIRSTEFTAAVRRLAPGAELCELSFADGETRENRSAIADLLGDTILPGATIVAPWRGDGHRDHRVVGEICAELADRRGDELFEYPIWMWHWADPKTLELDWTNVLALPLSANATAAKRAALAEYVSQTVGLGHEDADAPALSAGFLAHFARDTEYFVIESTFGSTKGKQYFEALYAANPDPWRMKTRWYEARKRRITAASLPRRSFRSALEIGCSVGELTATLAERCEQLLAIDISAAAVATARARNSSNPGVTVEQADATAAFPGGIFDLVVLSEVGYYWSLDTLRATIAGMADHLDDDGVVLACHWKRPVKDYPLSGAQVHDTIRRELHIPRIVVHEEDDFILEVFARGGASVAQQEGLVT